MAAVVQERAMRASAETIWALVREFGKLDAWHPKVVGPIEVIGDPQRVGAERIFRNDGVVVVREVLVERDEREMSLSYSITQAPFPLHSHRATLTVLTHEGGTVVRWRIDFETETERVEEVSARMLQTVEDGLTALSHIE